MKQLKIKEISLSDDDRQIKKWKKNPGSKGWRGSCWLWLCFWTRLKYLVEINRIKSLEKKIIDQTFVNPNGSILLRYEKGFDKDGNIEYTKPRSLIDQLPDKRDMGSWGS